MVSGVVISSSPSLGANKSAIICAKGLSLRSRLTWGACSARATHSVILPKACAAEYPAIAPSAAAMSEPPIPVASPAANTLATEVACRESTLTVQPP